MAKLDMKSIATAFLSGTMPAEEKAVYASLLFDALRCEAESQVNLKQVGKVISALSIQDLAVMLVMQDIAVTRAIQNLAQRQWVVREGIYFKVGEIQGESLVIYSQKFAEPVVRAERVGKATSDIGEKIRAVMAATQLNKKVEAIKKTDAVLRKQVLGQLTKKVAVTPSGRLLDYFRELHQKVFNAPYSGQLTASGSYSPAKELAMHARLLMYCSTNEELAKELIKWLVLNWKDFCIKTKWAGPCNISVLASVRGYNAVKDGMRGAPTVANRFVEGQLKGGPDVGFGD